MLVTKKKIAQLFVEGQALSLLETKKSLHSLTTCFWQCS